MERQCLKYAAVSATMRLWCHWLSHSKVKKGEEESPCFAFSLDKKTPNKANIAWLRNETSACKWTRDTVDSVQGHLAECKQNSCDPM